MTDPRWEHLKSGAMNHSTDGEPDHGYGNDGYLPAEQIARIVEGIEATPKRLEDYFIQPCGDPNVDPTAGKLWQGM